MANDLSQPVNDGTIQHPNRQRLFDRRLCIPIGVDRIAAQFHHARIAECDAPSELATHASDL
jgi:hypothetical protein